VKYFFFNQMHFFRLHAPVSTNPLSQLAIIGAVLLAVALSPLTVAAESSASTKQQTSQQGNSHDANSEIVDIVYPEWFKTSFMELEEDILEAQEAGKRLMLVFHQPGCPYCNAFVEQNLSQKDIEETVMSNFDVIEINMWGDLEVVNVDGVEFTEKTFAEHLKVQFTPTVLMYHSDGSIGMRINGYFPPDKFRASLEYVMNEDTNAQSFNEYLATVNPDVLDSSAQNTQTPDTYDYIAGDDFDTDQTIVLPDADADTPYLILFEQQDCANCTQFHETVLAEEEIKEMLKDFEVFRIDMWGRDLIRTSNGEELTGREYAKQLGINYAPTMVAYSSNHEEIIRSESWLRRFHTRTIFQYVLSDAWKEQPSFQRFIRERADEIRESGGTVSILE